jgi:cleavage and polyadenylation specificity factor subunit 1
MAFRLILYGYRMYVDRFSFLLNNYGTKFSLPNLITSCSKIVSDSDSNEKSPDTKVFMAIGTGIIDDDGEDVGSRGRVLLLDVKPTKYESFGAEINLLYEKEISGGPVTSVHTLASENCSRLIVGAGNEITIEQWGGGKLTQVGFFHCHMQVQDITVLKTFLLLSDAYDSIYFLVWRESDKSLTLLAKDYEPTEVYSSGMISRGGSLAFICHDDRQNLQFFSYAPGEAAARGGNKLVCRADFHLGAQTVSLQNHLCRSSLIINSANDMSTIAALKLQDSFFGKGDDDVKFAVHYGTSDGGYGSIVPINENIYWRLTALQSVMSNALESDCALSHRAWRLYRRTTRRGSCKNNDRRKGVIDGDLILKYSNLSINEQEDLASSIGSTVDLILDNMLEITCAASVL